jgi:hypothetical protein
LPCVLKSSSLLVFVTHFSFNFLLSSSHGSNPSSYHHHRLQCRPCYCLIFHSFSFTSRTEHVLKRPSEVKFMKLSFQRAIISMKRVPNNRVVPILLRRCNLSKADFRLPNTQMFLPYLLVRVFKFYTYAQRTTKYFFKIWVLHFFLFLIFNNIILYSIIQIYTCLDKFTIFKNYVSLKPFLPYTSNLNCKCIK